MEVSSKNLVGLGFYQGKTVFFNEENEQILIETAETKTKEMEVYKRHAPKLYRSFLIPLTFLILIMNRHITISGPFPLMIGFLVAFYFSLALIKVAMPDKVEVEVFGQNKLQYAELIRDAKKSMLILYTVIISFSAVVLITSIVYLNTSSLAWYFIAITSLIPIVMLFGTKLEKRRKLIKKIERYYS